MASLENPALKLVLKKGVNYCDSRPLALYFRLQGNKVSNIRGTDFMVEAIRQSPPFLKHYFLGSQESDRDKFKSSLLDINQHLYIVKINTNVINLSDSNQIGNLLNDVSEFNPDIVWLGVGSPKQDLLAAEIVETLQIDTFAVGAAFDFITGTKRIAPKFMQVLALEWLFRLLSEPKRLWRRYLHGNMKFLSVLLKDYISKSRKR